MENIISKHPSILDQFFDEETMSVHFKENVQILRKKWKPGWWEAELLEDKPSRNYLNNLINELYKEIDQYDDSFLEIDRNMSKVLQVWPYRTVIVIPPLSDWLEITVVKPVKKLTIEDYNLEESVIELLKNKAQWILLSWAPWQWKTTFAQALVELYVKEDKIIKTIESPRDLLVPDEVTQYSFSYAPHSEIRDILLLSRPDYTVYDEVRNQDDFQLFKDLRLTWIWLVWVIHATKAVDSIQRFLWNIEMWVIPQVVDTVIFINWWKPDKILQLQHTVKVPEWMESADLARPVIQVFDFFSQEVEYEIYSYWEEVVVMPLNEVQQSQEERKQQFSWLAEYWIKYIKKILSDRFNFWFKLLAEWSNSIKIIVADKNKWSIIWKQWSKIMELEKELWLSISVRTPEEAWIKDNDMETKLKEINNINNWWIEYEIIKKNKKEIVILYFWNDKKNIDVQVKIWNEIVNLTTDKKWQANIKNKDYIEKIKKTNLIEIC